MMAHRGSVRLFLRTAHKLSRSAAGKRFLSVVSRSVLIQRLTMGGPNPIRPWETDQEFQALLADVSRLSLNRPASLFNLYQLARAVRHLPGDVAEVGVYKGGTARLLGHVFAGTGKEIFLFDTFTGMPDAIDPQVDDWQPGDFADTSLNAVRQAVAQWPSVSCVGGIFPDTAGLVSDRRFAMAHIDVDIQRSVRDCLEFFYPRLVPAGALVIDDYGFRSCVGARLAVDDFFASRPEQPLYLPTGQCVVFRTPAADPGSAAGPVAEHRRGDHRDAGRVR